MVASESPHFIGGITMTTRIRFLALGALACAAVFLSAGRSEAQYRGIRTGRVYPPFSPNRMPGWDWRRTYPWSPYNYGRNPYNPIRYPYIAPYPVYAPYVAPYPVPYAVPSTPVPQGAAAGGVSAYPGDMTPTPTGPIKAPPPGAAEIELRVPDGLAQVWFDGENTYTMGTLRYYVTPELPNGKDLHYDVKVQWNRDGRPVTDERQITVRAGEKVVVDLTRPTK
jgi:uncharacterized protein (TIGR03000 family)